MSTANEPVWAFLSDVSDESAPAASTAVSESADELEVLAAAVAAIEEGILPPAPPDQEPVEEVVVLDTPERQRRRNSTAIAIGSGLVTLVFMIVFGLSLTTGSDGITQLTLLDGGDAVGQAVREGSTLTLDVALPPLARSEGNYVVWLFDDEVRTQISLGRLADDGVHTIPEGVDPRDVRVLDISVQPAGQVTTAHSGRSVARGILE